MDEIGHGSEKPQLVIVRGLSNLIEVMQKDVIDGDVDLDCQVAGSYLANFLRYFCVFERYESLRRDLV